jgi:hypothetical protein
MVRLVLLSFSLTVLCSFTAVSQELNCAVSVNHHQISGGSDVQIYESMRRQIYEFMNSRVWTKHTFTTEERIDCSVLITLQNRSNDVFKGTIQIQSRRPVFKTSYNSVILNHKDNDFQFQYTENQPLEYVENSHTSNLSSVLAYYAYLIIGLDFETFQANGGNEYLNITQSIVTAAQSASEPGWKSFESQKNRYWLIENLLNSRYSGIRSFLYKYHRLGMDLMTEDINKARQNIIDGLNALKKAYQQKPGLFFIQTLMSAKSDEIINVFSQADQIQKQEVVSIMKLLDPVNSSKYDKLMKA